MSTNHLSSYHETRTWDITASFGLLINLQFHAFNVSIIKVQQMQRILKTGGKIKFFNGFLGRHSLMAGLRILIQFLEKKAINPCF